MRTTTVRFLRLSRKRIVRAALCAALGLAGGLASEAAAAGTISLPDAACLSCAYEDGLPADGDDSASFDPASTFDAAAEDRPQILLPARRADRLERPRWSRGDKALMWSFASLSALDAYQTMSAPAHVREANPLLASWAGDHPSTFETLAFKGASTYGMYKLAGRIRNRRTRRLALVLMNVVQLSVAAHNEAVTGGVLF